VVVLPEIRATERTARGLRLTLDIPAHLSYFQGHFPGCPLLPGVVQITWAIELGRQLIPFSGRFRSLIAVKFTRVILPDTMPTLELGYASERRELEFVYDVDGRQCSSGTVLFDAS
jgi:3-hydroxymyristoyl/3-hydroxydecanoyl-(acyl carrier protein) dehydratase